jgi:hypothetical protein
MKKWSHEHAKCQNCGSERFPHKGKGYCQRCYPLVKKIEKVDCWDLSNPQSLKGFNQSVLTHLTYHPDGNYKRKLFRKIKDGYKSQTKERLDFFRHREEALTDQVWGLQIEVEFKRIASKCGIKDYRKLFYGSGSVIDAMFDTEQKKYLFTLLNKIQENIRWDGINWGRIFSTQTGQ